jgi:hypothetical protein
MRAQPARPPSSAAPAASSSTWASSAVAVVAGLALLVAGAWVALIGLSAVLGDALFVQPVGYLYALDLSRWGWALLALGALIAGAGIGVLAGGRWARVAGTVLAVLSLLAGFLFIPYYPIWAVLVIAMGLVVIWALTELGRVR